MGEFPDTIIIEENREEVNKLKEKLDKKEKTFTTLGKVGKSLTNFGMPVFIGSILSPFDFEGPVIEMVSALTLGVGALINTIAKKELEEIKTIRTNGYNNYEKINYELDQDTSDKIRNAIIKTMKVVNSKNKRSR